MKPLQESLEERQKILDQKVCFDQVDAVGCLGF